MTVDPSTLRQRQRAEAFYEDRYQHGYMDEWLPEKKRRVLEVIRELPLAATGDALDFGCGNGVLTEIVREALPGWNIYGTDISRTAIDNARRRFPDCAFFTADDPAFADRRFDFAFSHHVFEHVFDLREVFEQLDDRLKASASMLHILPCGNPGSFEHSVCVLRKDGIDPELENRFFFEDEGHVRRLTTEQFAGLCRERGFELDQAFYSNQYHGALDWITDSDDAFLRMFTDTGEAVDDQARRELEGIRKKLLRIAARRRPAKRVRKLLHRPAMRFKHVLRLGLALPMFLAFYPFDRHYRRKAREEWETRRQDPQGSEMVLYLRRTSG